MHTAGALVRVADMLENPRQPAARVSAAQYYRRDTRFSPEVDGRRIADAVAAAERAPDAREPGRVLARTWNALLPRLEAEPAGSVLLTRHGDAMALEDFLVTRVVELVLHGLDLADALERAPWTAPPALDVVAGLVFPGAAGSPVSGMDPLEAVRAATGRALEGRPDADALAGAGVRFLALN